MVLFPFFGAWAGAGYLAWRNTWIPLHRVAAEGRLPRLVRNSLDFIKWFSHRNAVGYMARFRAHNGRLFIDEKPVLAGWESFTGWYWFATEDRGENDYLIDGREVRGREYFGFVQGFEEEWGSWTTAEMDPLIKQNKIWPIRPVDLPYSGRRSRGV